MQWDEERGAVLQIPPRRGELIRVHARAGTGKTGCRYR